MTRHRSDRPDMIVDFIERHSAETGSAPSIREIGRAVGLHSTSAVAFHVDQLVREGRLTQDHSGIARSLRVIRIPDPETCALPGCGNRLTPSTQGSPRRWCSDTCKAIAAHVRTVLRAAGREHVLTEIGLS